MTNIFDWKTLMTQWNQELLAANLDPLSAPSKAIASKWLGEPGATEEEITALETRLGVSLPPSYRQFLQFSNGWWATGSFIERIWPTDDVEWLKVRHQNDIISGWTSGVTGDGRNAYPIIPDSEYYLYGEEQNPGSMRAEYLPFMLEISDKPDSEIMLLNPRVVSHDGEWEAWFLASWLPGAHRYRSFWDMMQETFQSFRRLSATEARRYKPSEPPEHLPEKLDGLIAELHEKAQQFNRTLPSAMFDIGIEFPKDARKKLDDQMSSMQQFNQGVMDALNEAAETIGKFRDQSKDPQALLGKVKDLAESSMQQSQESQNQTRSNSLNLLNMASMIAFRSRAGKFLYKAGYAQGQLMAAGTINWFIGKPMYGGNSSLW